MMAANLRLALDRRLATIPWMTPATRAKAREKLANMTLDAGSRGSLDVILQGTAAEGLTLHRGPASNRADEPMPSGQRLPGAPVIHTAG